MNRFFLLITIAFSASSLLLVDSAVKGALLLVFAATVALMLRRDSGATRHLVWLVAIVAMLFVPVLSALLPQWSVLPGWVTLPSEVKEVNTVVADGADVIDEMYESSETNMPHPTHDVSAAELPEPATPPAFARTSPPIAVDTQNQAIAVQPVVSLWSIIVPPVWGVGFLLLVIRLLAARLLLVRIEHSATIISHGDGTPSSLPRHFSAADALGTQCIVNTLISAKTQFAIHHRITLMIHPDKTIPVVWGIIRHRLLLPAAALQWSDEQLRSVLLHELAHIKRRDALVQLLTQLACALHWFNPLVWFAAWRMHVERERACDDMVLASGVRASVYAEHLLNVAARLSSPPWTQACGLAMARNSSLHGRLTAVLSEKQNRRSVSAVVLAACLLLGSIIAIPVAMLGAADGNQTGKDNTPPMKASVAVPATTSEKIAMKLQPDMEAHLDWGDAVNGLRAAVMIRTSPQENRQREKPHIYMVLKNASDKAIRFCDPESEENPSKGKGDSEPVRNRKWDETANSRTLYGRQRDGSYSSAMFSHGSTRTNVVLEPSNVVYIDFFGEPGNPDAKAGGLAVAERIIKDPSHSLSLVLNIIHAPDGAWTGKLETPATRGAFAALGPMPKSQEGQALFRYGVEHSRLNFEIPGGLISRLHDKVHEFIRLNDGDQFGGPYAKKMQPLMPRFEQKGDWSQAGAVALFDDIAAVSKIPLQTTLSQIHERTLQQGQPLPTSFEQANWGEPLPGGLRMAWVLEPGAESYHLGSSLRSRVLIHNSGNEPVAFVTRSFHQPEHKATKADGTAVQIESTDWTTLDSPEPYRLHPGEYCEVHAPGIGIGRRNNGDMDWANVRPGSWILANEDDEIVFQPGAVMLTGDHNPQVDPDWWLEFIKERVNRDTPLPPDRREREVILFRVIRDLFGNSPTPEEADAFYSDMSLDAVDNLALRLSERSWLTSVAGPIQAGKTTFRVLPEDPDAAARPRVAMNPGRYNLGDDVRFVVTRRPIGKRIVNEASIAWYPKGQDSKSHDVPLPAGYDSWAAAWSPDTTVLWVQHAGGLRRYDFSNPQEVKEEAVDADKLPAVIRAALPATFANPEKPDAPKPPPAASATQSDSGSENQIPPLNGEATNVAKAEAMVGATNIADKSAQSKAKSSRQMRQAREIAVEIEFAKAGVAKAKVDLEQRLQANRKAPGAFSPEEMRKTALALKEAETTLEQLSAKRADPEQPNQLKPDAATPKSVPDSSKLNIDMLEGIWHGEKDGIRVELSFPWSSEHQQAQWQIITGNGASSIEAQMSVAIEPDGIAAQFVFRKGLEFEALQGRVTAGENGTLRLEIIPNTNITDPGYSAVKDLVLTRQPDNARLWPKHESAQSLFRKWKARSRTDGKIPGALIGQVAKTLDDFVRHYPDNEATPRLAAIRPMFDASHDWNPADAVALLDDMTAITSVPLNWAESTMGIPQSWVIQAGKPLPVELENAAWGDPAENGLRAAWLLEPQAEQYPLGSILKARVLFHNSGTKPVVFTTETWHQHDRHSARDANNKEINVSSIWYTGWPQTVTYCLEPSDYVEVLGHGIGIGAGEYVEERSTGSLGAWIDAKEGEDVRFSSLVDVRRLYSQKDPIELREFFVASRVEQEAPLPVSSSDREKLLRRVTQDLFGEPPQQGELHDFLIDNSPDALARLIERLQKNPRIEPFVGELPTGEIPFRVLAVDPNVAKAPRAATGPGRYVLSDNVHLLVSRKTMAVHADDRDEGDTNKAMIMFLTNDPKVALPPKAYEIILPNGLETFALLWTKNSGQLMLVARGSVRKIDFTDPDHVTEERAKIPLSPELQQLLPAGLKFDYPNAALPARTGLGMADARE